MFCVMKQALLKAKTYGLQSVANQLFSQGLRSKGSSGVVRGGLTTFLVVHSHYSLMFMLIFTAAKLMFLKIRLYNISNTIFCICYMMKK